MNKYLTKKTLLVVGLLVIPLMGLLVVCKTIAIRNTDLKIPERVEVTNSTEPISVVCTRKERYDNQPQYDRALSLIEQRINESIEREKQTGPNTILPAFRYFPPELLNCIYIEEGDTGEAEGYFVSDNENIRSNYFPIFVSSKYSQTDDLTTAVLLVHEITHVQQYLDRLNSENKYTYKIKDCLYDEARAFVAQYEFYSNLNVDEVSSVGARMFSNTENPQIRMLDVLRKEDIKSGDVCGLDLRCSREVLRVAMQNYLIEDEFYSEQCNSY